MTTLQSGVVAPAPFRKTMRKAVLMATSITLVLGGLPLVAGPAQAADPPSKWVGPCRITAQTPEHTGRFTVSGKSIIAYPIDVYCPTGGIKVHIKQEVRESDNGPDETKATFWHAPYFHDAGTQTIRQEQWLHNTEGGHEEMYHRLKVRVESNGVKSEEEKIQSGERAFRH